MGLIDALEIKKTSDPNDFTVMRREHSITIRNGNDEYYAMDISSKYLGTAVVGFKNGIYRVRGTVLHDVMLDMIHLDICDCLSRLTMDEIRKAWKV